MTAVSMSDGHVYLERAEQAGNHRGRQTDLSHDPRRRLIPISRIVYDLAEYYQLEENLAAARKAIESAVRISRTISRRISSLPKSILNWDAKRSSIISTSADFGRDTEEMQQLRRLTAEDLETIFFPDF
jgi:hypothetical protein